MNNWPRRVNPARRCYDRGMPIALPACFIRDEVADIKEEAARFREMTPDERGRIVAALCAEAAAMLARRRDARRVRELRDPLPASTKAALARLRRNA
jgi:hypothetical protein